MGNAYYAKAAFMDLVLQLIGYAVLFYLMRRIYIATKDKVYTAYIDNHAPDLWDMLINNAPHSNYTKCPVCKKYYAASHAQCAFCHTVRPVTPSKEDANSHNNYANTAADKKANPMLSFLNKMQKLLFRSWFLPSLFTIPLVMISPEPAFSTIGTILLIILALAMPQIVELATIILWPLGLYFAITEVSNLGRGLYFIFFSITLFLFLARFYIAPRRECGVLYEDNRGNISYGSFLELQNCEIPPPLSYRRSYYEHMGNELGVSPELAQIMTMKEYDEKKNQIIAKRNVLAVQIDLIISQTRSYLIGVFTLSIFVCLLLFTLTKTPFPTPSAVMAAFPQGQEVTASITKPQPTAKPSPSPRPSSFPKTGTIFKLPPPSSDTSELTINTKGENGYVIKVVNPRLGYCVMSFFVGPGETATVNVPEGNYEIRYAYGSTWYGKDELFGEDTKYARKSDGSLDFTNYTWKLTLYPVVGGNMETESITADEF